MVSICLLPCLFALIIICRNFAVIFGAHICLSVLIEDRCMTSWYDNFLSFLCNFQHLFEIVNSEAISFKYRFCLKSADIYNALNFIMQ